MRRYSKYLTLTKYAMAAVIALVFVLYYLVGYNNPAPWDERYNAPLLTDLVIVLIALLFIAALGVVVFSSVRSAKVSKELNVVNGVKVRNIRVGVVLVVALIMAGAFALMPAGDIIVNGVVFTEELWLRISNMFVVSSVALIVLAVGSIVFGLVKNKRKRDAEK